MNTIETPNMPLSNGHYSQCVEHNGILYLSGQLPVHPETKLIPATIKEQTNVVLKKIETILLEAGSKINDIIQVRVYVSNIDLWDQVNTEYSIFFQDHKPARCIVPTRELHFGSLIEMEVTAISHRKYV